MARSDVPAAESALADVLRLNLEGHNYLGATTVAFYQARVAFCQGQLHRAATLCRERRDTLARLFEHPEQDLPAIRSLDVPLGIIQLEWNDLQGCAKQKPHTCLFWSLLKIHAARR